MARLARARTKGVAAAAVAAGLAVCAVPMTAQADSSRTFCLPFHATGRGQDLGGGHTQGALSVGRRQVGTTEAFFVLGQGTGPVFDFTGPLTFVPDRGPDASLVAELDGTFDTSTGHFGARSTSLVGSAALHRVTGDLRVDGLESLTDATFTETLAGRLCAPASGRRALERAVA